jgi:hypothetical protein
VRRLLTLLMLLALVVGQGSTLAAAICQHQSLREHIAARQGPDRKAAAAALTEEAAASVAGKKGALGGAGAAAGPVLSLPPAPFALPPRLAEPVQVRIVDEPPLDGTSVRPLLQPPSA